MNEIERAEKEFGVLDQVPVGVCVLRKDFSVLFWNRCLEVWTGISKNRITGTNIGSHFPHLNTPRYNVRLRDIFDGGPPTIFSSQLHRHIIPSHLKDGNLRIQHTTVTPVRALEGKGFYALLAIQDVTDLTCRIQDYRSMRDQAVEELKERKRVEEELRKAREDLEVRVEERTVDLVAVNEQLQKEIADRKQTEEVLRESEEKFRSLAEQLPNMILIHKKGRVVYVNKKCEEITGYGKEVFYSPSFDFRVLIDPDSLKTVEDIFARYMRGEEVPPYEYTLVAKAGNKLDAIHTTKIIRYEGEDAILGIITDITERKRTEEEFQKAHRLESIGILAGGIAHDFNNLLTAILGNIDLAKEMAPLDDAVLERLDEAEKASIRAKDLTQQLLTFSKGGKPLVKVVSMPETIRETTRFALRGSNVRCEFQGLANLWPVRADEGQISQVINNLIINATQAMPEGGTLRIICDNETIRDDAIMRAGRYVRISVKDHGVGITAEHLEKIFDPYFTTKEGGSGLGLATTYSIVKRHGGHITVQSEAGVGSVFHVFLPASEEEPPAGDRKEKKKKKSVPGEGHILVMDDEEKVRVVARRMLNRLGYEAEGAADGAEALKLYSGRMKSGNPFRAVIMDLTIPGGIGGKEAIRKLLEIDPNAKAIVSSGYSNDPVIAEYEKHGFCGVLSKPYTVKDLSEALLQVLNGTAG